MRSCVVWDLGRIGYQEAFDLQRDLVAKRRHGLIPDHLLIVEHPHVITMGRNGRMENVLASSDALSGAGITFHQTDRGGDVTYHGPGQVVGYPILDLREWKRDIVAYVRGLEQVIIDALADFGLVAGRIPGWTGVWVGERKIAAIGVHISRWVTSHGFALNLNTDLTYFGYIVPCGLTKPVTSIEEEGVICTRADVVAALARHFGRIFDCEMESALVEEKVL
jgi:lipoyl(octanoyl) transferase